MQTPTVALAAGGSLYLGPLHPLSQGQVDLQLELADDRVLHARFDARRQHRGDSKLFEVREFAQTLALANRPVWLTPAAGELALLKAAELLLGLNPPPRAQALRVLVLNLQLLQGWLWWLAAMADLLDQSPRPFLELREEWTRVQEQLTGARIHDAYFRFGGVAADISPTTVAQIAELSQRELPELQADAWIGQARLSAELVQQFNVSGLPLGDSDASGRVRHIHAQADAVRRTLGHDVEHLPAGGFDSPLPKSLRVPVGEALETMPSANGDFSCWLWSDGGKTPLRVHLASNAERAAAMFELAAIGRQLDDARLLLATLPLSAGELAL